MINCILAKVIKREEETPDIVSIYLETERPFKYEAGQYITVYFDDISPTIGKAYSLSSSPNEKHLRISVKKIGLYSGRIHALKMGDTLKISQAYGYLNMMSSAPIIAAAGGLGISPIISIIKDELFRDNNKKIDLFYSCRTKNDIALKNEVMNLASNYPNFNIHMYITRENDIPDRWINHRIDFVQIKSELNLNSVFYICGSGNFVRAIRQQLMKLNVKNELIATEALFRINDEIK